MPRGVSLTCAFEAAPPPRPRVDLLLALPRPKVLRRLWSQVAALGVGQVMLTNAARVERDYFDAHVLAPSTYGPLLIEGLQQARDTRLPIVTVHRRFKVLVEDDLERLFPAGVRVAAHPGGGAHESIRARLGAGAGRMAARAARGRAGRRLDGFRAGASRTARLPHGRDGTAHPSKRHGDDRAPDAGASGASGGRAATGDGGLASPDAATLLADEVRARGLHHRRPEA